jgi:hypothetical protein
MLQMQIFQIQSIQSFIFFQVIPRTFLIIQRWKVLGGLGMYTCSVNVVSDPNMILQFAGGGMCIWMSPTGVFSS